MARDTKLGQEEITRDIPNVGEEVKKPRWSGRILKVQKSPVIFVWKGPPKGESPITPEEKL